MALLKPTPQQLALNRHIDQVLRELGKDGALYRLGWDALLNELVARWHQIPVRRASTEELRLACAHAIEKEPASLPLESRDLAAKLGVHRLPKEVFVEEHTRVAADLRAIRANIQECESALGELDARQKIAREDGDGYRSDYLRYKIAQNERAREQIIEYLENGVTEHVIEWVRKDRLAATAAFAFFGPYPFRMVPDLFSAASLSEIENKLGTLYAEQVQWFEDLYRRDREEFHKSLSEYITERNIVHEIRESLKNHHRLAARAEVLSAVLDVYCEGKLALFCNVVPIQVEGLLGDYCVELGISEGDLRSAALASKLEKIRAKSVIFVDFEYFRFHFPVVRNRVAHGRLDSKEAPRLADLLLLDLADVCGRMYDEELPVNKLVGLVRRMDLEAPEPADLFRLAMMEHVELPAFYELEARRRDIEVQFSGKEHWDWIDALVEANDPVIAAGLYPVVAALKGKGLDGRRAKSVLAKLQQASERPSEREFWKAIYQAKHRTGE